MSVDSRRRELKSKTDAYQKAKAQTVKAQVKVADATHKVTGAKKDLARAKTASSIKSKGGALERAELSLSKAQDDVTSAQKKEAKTLQDMNAAQENLAKEEKRESEKQEKARKNNEREMNRAVMSVSSSVRMQEQRAKQLESRVSILEALPGVITVLYFAASPVDEERIRLDEEAREIREAIRKADHRDSIDFQTRWATRTTDLLQQINENQPTIVHFSGHGANTGEMVLEDAFGNSKLVNKAAIALAVSTACPETSLLVFNACFSAEQAEKLISSVDAVIGMSDSISDGAAVAFAAHFYSAIGFGCSLQGAFDQARAALVFDYKDEFEVPQLYCASHVDSKQIFYVSAEVAG